MSASLDHARAAGQISIDQSEYRKFSEFFYRQTGILFADNKRYFVDKRLIERMTKTRSRSFDEYFAILRRSEPRAEIEALINLLTINETYFYREEHQLQCLAEGLLPEIAAERRKGDRLRIWSLPCSTGEEPYSIAMHLLENWRDVDDYEIEILASDIDTNALRAAEAGVYDARSLHRLPRQLVARYFTSSSEDSFRLIDSVRQSVRFTQVNAADAPTMRDYAHIDVIFCRNMLIYFDDRSRRQVVESIYDSLCEGGFICLGHSESMSRISPLFTVRKFTQGIVYQKRGGPR